MIKKCLICGAEYVPAKTNAHRQKYCSRACSQKYWTSKRKREHSKKANSGYFDRATDRPIPYSPKLAQAAHDRQAEIERRARAEGLSYGKYQMKLYMERVEG